MLIRKTRYRGLYMRLVDNMRMLWAKQWLLVCEAAPQDLQQG